MQGKCRDAGQLARIAQGLQLLFQEALAFVDGRAETALLGGEYLLDQGAVFHYLGIDGTHLLDDGREVLAQKRLLDAQHAPLAHGTADQAAQDIAAPLVGGQDAVACHEDHGTGMVGNHAHGEIRARVLAVSLARDALAHSHQAAQDVGVEVGLYALHDGRDALQAHTGVDVFLLQRVHRAVFVAVELGKHEVPVLEEAVAVAARLAIGAAAAHLRALVVVHLGARAARAGGTCNPEVVVFT